MKNNELARLNKALEDIQKRITSLENLKDDFPTKLYDTKRLELQGKKDDVSRKIAALFGSGAMAQGDGSVAAGERGIGVGEDVSDSVLVSGNGNVVAKGDKDAIAINGEDVAVATGQSSASVTKTYYLDGKPTADPKALRHVYLNKVMCATGILPLEGIDPKTACSTDDHLSLSAVYTALLIKGGDHEKPEAAMPRDTRETRRASALELLNKHQHMVLLGDPGSGKSTFVNFVALCLAGQGYGDKTINLSLLTTPLPKDEEHDDENPPQPWNHGPLLPVRVILRDFAAKGLSEDAGAGDLWDFIAADLKTAKLEAFAPHLEEELRKTGGLVLLDGLDEVTEAKNQRMRIKRVVERFKAGFPKCRMLITSRTYAYQKQEWRVPDFAEAVLAPFSKGQIIQFVGRWYAHIAGVRGWNAQNAGGKAELLKRAILSSERLRGLAERPILLTLMAILHAGRGGSLPEKREELYAETVDMLLDRWESEKIIRDAEGKIIAIEPSLAEFLKADKDRIRRVLDKLAYKAHASQPELRGTADISEKDLVFELVNVSDEDENIKTKKLIRFLNVRAGLLVPRGIEVYTFPHRTFQEYLAACHLTNLDFPDQVAELARREPDRWREVALLAGAKAAAGASSNIWNLAEELCFKPLDAGDLEVSDSWGALLAGQALAETAVLENISQRNQPKLDRIRQWQIKIIEGDQLPALERASAGRHLAALGDPRKEVTTLNHMQFCLVPDGPFYMGEDEDEHLNEYLKYNYWIGKHPVSNAQFAEFVNAGGYAIEKYWSEAKEAGFWKDGKFKGTWDSDWRSGPEEYGNPFNLANHPVVGVSWYEALAFTRWLTDRFHADGILHEKWRIRLPSEAEWEKAARGGVEITKPSVIFYASDWRDKGIEMPDFTRQQNTMPKRKYPWGDEISTEKTNYRDTGIGSTSALGCFSSGESPYGALDMAGNVWEWIRSVYIEYPYDPNDGREDLSHKSDSARVLRGGSFGNLRHVVRCADRDWNAPDFRYHDVGVRCVCAPITSELWSLVLWNLTPRRLG